MPMFKKSKKSCINVSDQTRLKRHGNCIQDPQTCCPEVESAVRNITGSAHKIGIKYMVDYGKSIMLILNFLKFTTILWLYKRIYQFLGNTNKYFGVSGHDVCNSPSSGSK